MGKFIFKEIDDAGHDTLNALARAGKFNAWMYETIAPHLSGNILEIGSGTGNLSEFLLKDQSSLWLSDIRKNYCEYLASKFSRSVGVKGILQINLTDPEFDTKCSTLFNSFDSIFALNVVEHIHDDDLAIKNSKKMLKSGGKLLILVPAYQGLYNNFDRELEHYRRYSRKSLKKLMENHLQIVHSQYFNLAGLAGWFVSGTILRKKIIPSSELLFFNKLVPVFRVADKMIFNKAGLSVIAVGKKE